jgi:hypothetical protein
MVKKSRIWNSVFSLTALRLRSPCGYFLIIFLTLLIFYYFTNTGILGMMGLKTLLYAKVRNLLRVNFNIFNWPLIEL